MRSSSRVAPLTPLVVLVLAAALASLSCREAAPPAAPPVSADTWAVVDSRPISRDNVEKAYRRTADPSQTLSDDEAMTAKLNLLNELIVQDLLLAKASQLKVEVPQGELDTAFADGKKNLGDAEFQKELSRRNLTADDMREGLRRDLLIQKVIEQEIGAKVSVTEQDISRFFEANRPQFNVPEESYHLAQIVVTPEPEPQVSNRTGDDARSPEAANAKLQMLLEKLKGGASFRDLAQAYSEDLESAPRGGDLGLVPMSRLKQAPPQLRNAVLNQKPGTINLASAGGAHTLVLVVAHEPAGQRDLAMPAVRERITEVLRGRKEQLLRAAYLTSLRDNADVVNYLARRLVESNSAPPSLQPAAPGAK
jgi:parvulin-like peptidyl-prolyl isomerase